MSRRRPTAVRRLPLACLPPFLLVQRTRAVGSASNVPDRVNPASLPVKPGSNLPCCLRASLAADREINGPDHIGSYSPSIGPPWTHGPGSPPVHGRAHRLIYDQRRRSRPAPVNLEPRRLFCRKAPELLLITKMPFHLQRSLQFSPGFHVEAPELLCFFHPRSKPCSFTPKPLCSCT
jgi:hypothetical protein